MRILISGIMGHMGRAVLALANRGFCGATAVAGVDVNADETAPIPTETSFDTAESNVDCIIDFSHHAATGALLDFAVRNRLPLVLATTGQTEEEKAAIRNAAARIPIFFAANYSLGIAILIDFAKRAALAMPEAEIEIIETHHDRKLDAPSGTALAIADAICEVKPESTLHPGRVGNGKRTKEEIGIHSLRMGNVVGVHEVILATPSQTITLKHEAHDRSLFAEGALTAAAFLVGRPAGLYTMNDMIKD